MDKNAKTAVKDEFKKFNDYIMIVQKHVNNELVGLMQSLAESNKEENENKPTPEVRTPLTESQIVETKYNPMTNYNKSYRNDYRLTMKSTWIEYKDWKRRIVEHFDYVEHLPTQYFTRRVLLLKYAMDIH